MEFYEKLFQALKSDNLKEFEDCMATTNCGPLRLGRFPVLSVMYLYNSRRILRAYEKSFLKHNSWRDIGEPVELSAKLRSVAGKCLRLYLNETVSPVEMLLLLNRDAKLRRVFSRAHVTPPVKQRLHDIYYIRWGLQAEFSRNKIVLQRRPLTRSERLQWLMASVCVLLCVALAVGTPFAVNAFAPFIPDGNGVITVTKWQQIKFASDKIYALDSDVTVAEGFFAREMNCEIRGNNHKVTVKGGVFGSINGTLTDVIFETDGTPVAENITAEAKVDNVTVNVTVDRQVNQASGFFADSNYGSVTNVTVNATGVLNAVAANVSTPEQSEDGETPSFYCGGIVATNKGLLQGCVANYSNFTLHGQREADAAFGGIVGTNGNFVEDCRVTGKIVADTFDVAGICAENNYYLGKSTNGADITQQSQDKEWSPIVAGVVMTNYYAVEYCTNTGTIHATGVSLVEAAGIAGAAHGYVYCSVNRGDIVAQTQQGEVHAGGIAGRSCAQIYGCLATGNVTATGAVCCVGGVLGYSFAEADHNGVYFGRAEYCIADCQINVTAVPSDDGFTAVGGIVGYMAQYNVHHTETVIVKMSGKVICSYFTGELSASDGVNVGAITGVVGEYIYNSIVPDDKESNFYGNVYADGCGVSNAYGAAFADDESFHAVADKGAQQASVEDIVRDEIYQKILELLGLTSVQELHYTIWSEKK